tara:strand:- start:229 stop:507 length:279 start_codon:yes stop_codon:yes gene_type:complete
MHALNIEVLGFLTLVKILDPTVGKLKGIPQIRWAVLPGLLHLSRRHPQRVRKETVELLGERHQSAVTFSAHALDDGFDRGCGLPLCLPGCAG